MPVIANSPLQFAGANAEGWRGAGEHSVFYYIHQGYVYLVGRVVSEPGVASATILTLPEGARPLVETEVEFAVDPTDSPDHKVDALAFPTTIKATVHPSGAITLAEVPATLTTAPSVATYFFYERHGVEPKPLFIAPFTMSLVVGNVRWPIEAPPADNFSSTLAALGPYVGPDFTDSGSQWSEHGIDPLSEEPLPWPVSQPSRVHMAGALIAAVDGASSLLMAMPGPDKGTALWVGGGFDYAVFDGRPVRYDKPGMFLLSDSPIRPAGDSPPLVSVVGEAFEGNYNSPQVEGPGELPTGFGKIAESLTRLGGEETCEIEEHGHILVIKCHLSTGAPPHLEFSTAALVALCNPDPDWFLVRVTLEAQQNVHIPHGPDPLSGQLCPNPPLVSCQDQAVWDRNAQAVEAPWLWVEPNGETVIPTNQGEGAGKGLFPHGYIMPASSDYKGEPGISLGGVIPAALWKRGQTGTIKMNFGTFPTYAGRFGFQAEIIPFYNRRQFGLHAGDVLDLTGCGWQGTDLVNLGGPPSIGPGTQAIVPNGT